MMGLEELAPGVMGYTVEMKELWVPFISATEEGSGSVGRYLDSLPEDISIVIPTVISERLDGMLRRRGYVPELRYDRMSGEHSEEARDDAS